MNTTKPAGVGGGVVPCGLCGNPTYMAGTKRCDGCWELEKRVRDNPEAAKKILAAFGSAAPAGDGVQIEWDGATRTTQEHLYLMTGERDRYKAIAERAQEQIELRDRRIAELTATPAGGGEEQDNLANLRFWIKRDVPASCIAESHGRAYSVRDNLLYMVDEMIHRLASTGSAQGAWRPIESAPKDGTSVLLACPSGCRWIDHANDSLADWGTHPTHWQPLPAAPTQE